MKPSPSLIPRLDVDFNFKDFVLSLSKNGASRASIQNAMNELFPDGQALFVDSGRTALFLALKAMGLPKGARVGVPLYLCEVVFKSVVLAGCTPVFLDVNPRTFTLNPEDLERKSDKLDVIVPAHLFGHPCDMDSIHAICGSEKIVEDCAHGLGSFYKEKPVGSFGRASFYSFGLGKPLSVGRFGMFLSEDVELTTRAREIIESFPKYSGFGRTINSLKDYGRSALYQPPWFGIISLPIGSLLDRRIDFMDKTGFDPHLATEGSLKVFTEQLRRYPEKVRMARENARILSDALSASNIMPPVTESWASHTFFQFAMRFETKASRDKAAVALTRDGIDSIKFYHDSPSIASNYGYRRDCPVAEQVADTVLTIPCYGRLPKEKIQRIADSLRRLGGKT